MISNQIIKKKHAESQGRINKTHKSNLLGIRIDIAIATITTTITIITTVITAIKNLRKIFTDIILTV